MLDGKGFRRNTLKWRQAKNSANSKFSCIALQSGLYRTGIWCVPSYWHVWFHYGFISVYYSLCGLKNSFGICQQDCFSKFSLNYTCGRLRKCEVHVLWLRIHAKPKFENCNEQKPMWLVIVTLLGQFDMCDKHICSCRSISVCSERQTLCHKTVG